MTTTNGKPTLRVLIIEDSDDDVIGAFLNTTAIPASTTYHSAPFKGIDAIGNQVPWPEGGVLSNMNFRLSGAQPASGSLVVTLVRNSVATALVITVPAGGAGGTYSNNVNTVNLNAGDTISWTFQNNATSATAGVVAINMKLTKTTT